MLLGDELDSPRGRIYLIKEMLEKDQAADGEVVKHIDRCLSCLACMTTCPSGVNYMHLVDQARVGSSSDYQPAAGRAAAAPGAGLRAAGPEAVSHQPAAGAARPALRGLAADAEALGDARPDRGESRRCWRWRPAGCRRPARAGGSVFAAHGEQRGRVALLQGCAQQVLAPRINQAAISLLTRHGIEVVLVKDEQCCGALTHHLGRDDDALAPGARQHRRLARRRPARRLDAILVTTSGCGTVIKDYGYHAARGPRLRRPGGEGLGAGQGHHRVSSRASNCERDAPTRRHRRRLSLGLFAAARAENHDAFRKNCFPRTDSW